jgi:hypothetical protein
MHVVIAVGQQRVAEGREDARFVTAEMVGKNQVDGLARLRLVEG